MSNTNDTEIEVQVKVEFIDPLIYFLKEGVFVFESNQKDEYYSPAHRDFLAPRPIHEWLRLRDSGGRYSITYKDWKYNNEGLGIRADEYESKIESIDALVMIFKILDFKHLVTVVKNRKVWRHQDYEISVDTVEGLGNFVEVEYKGNEEILDPEAKMKEMIVFLKEIGCGKVLFNNGGYPDALMFPHEVDLRVM